MWWWMYNNRSLILQSLLENLNPIQNCVNISCRKQRCLSLSYTTKRITIILSWPRLPPANQCERLFSRWRQEDEVSPKHDGPAVPHKAHSGSWQGEWCLTWTKESGGLSRQVLAHLKRYRTTGLWSTWRSSRFKASYATSTLIRLRAIWSALGAFRPPSVIEQRGTLIIMQLDTEQK